MTLFYKNDLSFIHSTHSTKDNSSHRNFDYRERATQSDRRIYAEYLATLCQSYQVCLDCSVFVGRLAG